MSGLPAWLIADSEDRTFIYHALAPRFLAEVLEDEDGDSLHVVQWIDEPPPDAAKVARLMCEAGEFHATEAEREFEDGDE